MTTSYLLAEPDGLPARPSGAWAKEKLDYLERYIHVFETSMRQQWAVRHYIDLFVGPGKCKVRTTGEILLGSPLLSLTTEHPFTRYFFVDLSGEHVNALRERCAASPLSDRVTIIQGDSNVAVDDIVAQINAVDNAQVRAGLYTSLNLAFLDPEGIDDLRWSTVRKLASVRRMDLIINYPQGPINRNLSQAMQRDASSPLDAFFSSQRWRDVYQEHVQQYGSRGLNRCLLDLYQNQLRELGYQDIRGEEETGDEVLIRSARRRLPLYYLIFASKHPLGVEFWRKVVQRNVAGQRRLL